MPESSDDDEYDMRSESGSVAHSITDTATSKATPSRSGSPHASAFPAPAGRNKRRSGSGLRDVSIPPQPTRRITTKEAARLAAMERVRLTGAQPDWPGDGSSDEGEAEGEEEAPIQETDIVGESSPQVMRTDSSRSKSASRRSQTDATNLEPQAPPEEQPDSSRIHPAFLSAQEQRELQQRYQPYQSDFPEIIPLGQTIDRPAVPPLTHQTPVGQVRQTSSTQRTKDTIRSSVQRSGQSRRAVPPPVLLRSNEADVFGSGQPSLGSLDLLADTLDQAQPMTPTTSKTMAPSLMPPPVFKTPAPVSKSRSNVNSKKPRQDHTGPDNNEAAEILLAISASPAPTLRKTALNDDVGDHAQPSNAGPLHDTTSFQSDRVLTAPRQLDLGADRDVETREPKVDSKSAAMDETPSRPSGPRKRPVTSATPLRKLPMRSSRTVPSEVDQPPSDDEFAVPELQSASKDPSSSVSKRHEDSPITPAELQPAADILPYRRGKPPVYGRKDDGDKAIIAKSDLSSPPTVLSVSKAPTPTPKASALRAGVTPFQGYRPGALATPARPGTIAGIAASPADYTTFSSPSGLDLTQKLGLAPAPTVPESPTWLEMVRATPDVRHKRARPGSMDSDAGTAPGSPRKRVRV